MSAVVGRWRMLVLAAADSYSRVYVGVHYPTDDLAGVVGLWVACGWIEARCVVGTGSRLGERAVRGKRAALVKRFRTVQYLDSKNKQEQMKLETCVGRDTR
jgi:hypothetical protein